MQYSTLNRNQKQDIWRLYTNKMLDEIWDAIVDGFMYIISFEWLSDTWDFITGMFENLGEFSVGGFIFGVLTFGFIYLLRDYMLKPFLIHMGSAEAIFWGGMTYICGAIGGYIIGKRLFDD